MPVHGPNDKGRPGTVRSDPLRLPAKAGRTAAERPALTSWRLVLLVWVPIVVINVLHYTTASHEVWVHNVLRRLFYLPIVVAALQLGVRGGLGTALVVSLTYVPHAFFNLGPHAHRDPAGGVDKALEIVMYNVVGVVSGVLADLEWRHRRALHRALREHQRLHQQLVRAGRLAALGEVVAGIAHEIKNPLHSLKGTAELIGPFVPETVEEHRMWQLHVAELDRLERVATRFLSFASPQPLVLDLVDLRDVAQRLAGLAAAEARKRGVTLEVDLPSSPVCVHGDRDQLAQVALNIVLNAFQAIGDKSGLVRVEVLPAMKDREAMHRLRFENDGPAIPEDELDRMFDPFHATGMGTGLGLAISERIVEQHGGFIECSNAGIGVRFTVHLPACEDARMTH